MAPPCLPPLILVSKCSCLLQEVAARGKRLPRVSPYLAQLAGDLGGVALERHQDGDDGGDEDGRKRQLVAAQLQDGACRESNEVDGGGNLQRTRGGRCPGPDQACKGASQPTALYALNGCCCCCCCCSTPGRPPLAGPTLGALRSDQPAEAAVPDMQGGANHRQALWAGQGCRQSYQGAQHCTQPGLTAGRPMVPAPLQGSWSAC